MINKFPFPNYIYLGSKPIKNQGDSSIDSDSFKGLDDEIEKKNDSLIKKKKLLIPREKKKPLIKFIKKKKETNNQKALKLTPHSSTRYTEKISFKNSEKDKESFLNIKSKNNILQENNRYNNYFHKIIKNNYRFLSCLKDEESDYAEGIIDNEISVNFVEGFNLQSKKNKESQVEIPLDNISRINTNSEISNNFESINRLIFSKTNNTKNQNSFKENLERKIKIKNKNDFDIDNYMLENKENFNPNKQYDKEIQINLKDINKSSNKSNIIYLDKSKSFNSKLKSNNKYFDLKKSQKSFVSRFRNNQRNSNLNLTKKYKIFHKFLSIGIDTSGLSSLDDEMNNFILNPKINYNFPFNNLENELE